MDAGRELDALVAENVMGLPVCDKPRAAELPERCNLFTVREHLAPDDLMMPAYTTSIEAAWQVITKADECELWNHTGKVWGCRLSFGDRDGVAVKCATAPLAICRAALAAVNSGVPA